MKQCSFTCVLCNLRKLAFALKFRCCHPRSLFGSFNKAAIFSEFKSEILFLLKVILYILKMGLIHQWSRVIHRAWVPLTDKPGALPAPFACILGDLCETALMPWSPCERMARSELVFSPFSPDPRQAGCSIRGRGRCRCSRAAAETSAGRAAKGSSCSGTAFPGLPYTGLCWLTHSERGDKPQEASVSKNLYRASGASCY